MRLRRSSASLLAAIAAAILLTQPAFALEPGVHVSPSSPAGIEYAFPLGNARGELSGVPLSSSAASTYSAPRFGIGITKRATKRGAAPATRGAAKARPVVAKARSLEATLQPGSLGDLILPLTGAVLLVGILGGVLGSVLGRRQAIAS